MDQAVNPDLFSIFDVLIFVAPYILANRTSRNPGMGRKEGCMTRFVPSRYRLQAFVSTILKRLNKPPFLPQLCSTLSKLVVIHTMAPRPTVIGSRVIGVDLPAFLLSKNVYSESIGMPRSAVLQSPFPTRPRCGHAKVIGSGLVWRDLPVRVARTRLPALCFPQLPLGFCFVILAALRLASEIPCGTSCHSSLATNHYSKLVTVQRVPNSLLQLFN